MGRIVEQCGDEYRVWSTTADCYASPPRTREETVFGLFGDGFGVPDIQRMLANVVKVEQWADATTPEEDRELDEFFADAPPPPLEPPPLYARDRDFAGTRCQHPRILLDDIHNPKRGVECRDCGERLDAFTVLYGYATKERTHHFQAMHARTDLNTLRTKIEEAKKELASLRGKIRRERKHES